MAVSLLLAAAACSKSSSESAKKSSEPKVVEPAKALGSGCGIGLDMAPEAAVATIDGKAIPCSELYQHTSALALSAEAEFREELRALHQAALANLIDERLLQAEADKKGQSITEFVASTLSITPTTPEEAKAFYDEAVARGEQLPPYEQITEDLIGFLNERKQKSEMEAFRDSLRSKTTIEKSLPVVLPPQFTVDATGPSQGGDEAAVTIVEFSDYECHFCGKAEPTVKKLLVEYGDKVRIVYRDYPLPNHTNAPKAAEAAHCAGKQDKFWQMHDLLFENQRALGIEELKGYATKLGLDSEKFSECLDSGEMKPIVVASLQEGEKVGVTGTPAFFVNGRLLSGAQPFERFKEVIDHELASK